jgi:hypothetical protein
MLSVDNVANFLLERGLFENGWIVDGNLTARSAARRNRNLRIEGPDGIGFLIKQPDDLEDDSRETLRHEAAFFRFCGEEPAATEVARFIPRLLLDDPAHAIAVFELIPRAVSLWSSPDAQDNFSLLELATRSLGHAIGTLHRCFRADDWAQDPRLKKFRSALPWAFMVHKPGVASLGNLSAAEYQAIRLTQNVKLSDQLDRLCLRWQVEAMIHGDIRLDNILIRRDATNSGMDDAELWIVDWELIRFGDPAWDLAGVLQDCLSLWVSSMPLSDGMRADEMISQARVPLSRLWTVSRSIWAGYREQAGLTTAQANDRLLRAVEFSGVRLIQSVFELAHDADQLAGHSAVLLQVSMNLLAEPELGQIQLYGIPLG